ncbi:MAG: DUF3179 domain-containing protein, partial [Candidatus Binatia bacterium]
VLFPWEVSPPPPSLVPLEEIRSGGPPPDGIPPIDAPKLVDIGATREWLQDREPVLALVHGGEARAYPLQILTWHEIVNDEVAGDPITVTYCPLCNSGIAFDRRVSGRVLDFGTSGRLYNSNLVMYDRQTKSLWIQFTGQAVAGPFMRTELRNVPVQMVSFADFRTAHPDGKVLSRQTGFARSYGTNPYSGYDDVSARPFLFDGSTDDRLRPMDRVLAVRDGDAATAYPSTALEARARDGATVVSDSVGSVDLVVFYRLGTASALDDFRIAEGRDVGATGVFRPEAAGRRLDFEVRDGEFVDAQTGSVWNVLGEATAGELRGERLAPVVHDDTFWFVWAVFRPQTAVWSG